MGVLVNGVDGATLDPADRGTAYGDGVFRTMRLREGRALSWHRHYRKLHADCAAIGIVCATADVLANELARASQGVREATGKIIVTRGAGKRGYAVSRHPQPTRIVSTHPAPEHPESFREEGIKVHRCRIELAIQPRLAGVKHLNRLENVLARMEWTDPDVQEGLLLDREGHLVEGISSNLFLVRSGMLLTPDLSRCGVSGVTRERIIEIALGRGVPLRVAALRWNDLVQAEEVFLVNSLIGAWQIRSVGETTWKRGVWTARVREWLDNADAS